MMHAVCSSHAGEYYGTLRADGWVAAQAFEMSLFGTK